MNDHHKLAPSDSSLPSGGDREKYTQVANDLADWINHRSKELGIKATDLHPVYAAHVLLCELIREPTPPAGTSRETYHDSGLPIETEVYGFLDAIGVTWNTANVKALTNFIKERIAKALADPSGWDVSGYRTPPTGEEK